MIASIRGEVLSVWDDSLVVDVSGVGFQVYVSNSILAQVHPGEPVFLHTYLLVREDMLALYGFEREEERRFFLLLLGVNGVGPRLSLAVLSALSPDTIRRAVLSEQAEVFARVPGVGKKTALKIQLHLQGKVDQGGALEGQGGIQDTDTEVLEALTALGYSVIEAQSALQSIPKNTSQDVESRLRAALQYFT
jgi:Holliday junction DNA helicase RuvA